MLQKAVSKLPIKPYSCHVRDRQEGATLRYNALVARRHQTAKKNLLRADQTDFGLPSSVLNTGLFTHNFSVPCAGQLNLI